MVFEDAARLTRNVGCREGGYASIALVGLRLAAGRTSNYLPGVMNRLLIANRGEIAIRIVHAAAKLGIGTVAVSSEDDTASLHTRKPDDARPLWRSHGDAK